MGCWDVYCFICGNPCHSMLNSYIDSIKESVNQEIKSYPNLINDLIDLEKNVKWMNNCSMLLTNDKVKHNMKEVACNVTFCNNNFCASHMGKQISNCDCSFIDNCGVFIHTDCWKFIKKTYDIELKFSNLPKIKYYKQSELKKIKDWGTVFDINYGDIKTYWAQDFMFGELVCDKKKYLCSSPLKNDKNIKQIKKNISALKIKNDPERIGPETSATFYDEGDIKLGKNKYFWIKKNNKWLQINEKPIKISIDINITKLTNKEKKYIEQLPYIGQYNINPIFIISSDNTKKNIYNLKLLLTETYKDTLMKNIPK
jgi:hypothetical protein